MHAITCKRSLLLLDGLIGIALGKLETVNNALVSFLLGRTYNEENFSLAFGAVAGLHDLRDAFEFASFGCHTRWRRCLLAVTTGSPFAARHKDWILNDEDAQRICKLWDDKEGSNGNTCNA